MIKNSKAISPIIAITLLVVLSLASVISLQTFLSPILTGIETNVEEKASPSSLGSGTFDVTQDKIHIRNPQTETLEIREVRINGIDCGISTTVSGESTTSFSLGSCEQDILPGEAEIVIVTDKGVEEKKTFLKSTINACTNQTPEGFAGGDGSVGDPFQVCNCFQLQNISNHLSDNYVLTSDIDCYMTPTWNSGNGFSPIGTFTGTLDGQGHSINSLYIGCTSLYCGLFSTLQGNVSNLNLLNLNVTTTYYGTGGLIGYLHSPNVVDNVYVQGSLSSTAWSSGLLVGRLGNWGGTGAIINNSHSSGIIRGNSEVGGLVGSVYYSGIIDNSYSDAIVYGDTSVGGLAGYGNWNSRIENSYATGDVIAYYRVGGLVGYLQDVHLENSYATGDISLNVEESSSGPTYAGGLIGYAKYAALVENSYSTGQIISNEWTVGGLVGKISNTPFNNTYSTGDVTGGDRYVGGLAGEVSNYGYNIENSYASGNVNGSDIYVGGLIGYIGGDFISNSFSTGSVTGGSYLGGLIGGNYANLDNVYWNNISENPNNATGNTGNINVTVIQDNLPYFYNPSNPPLSNWSSSIWSFSGSSLPTLN